MKSFDGALGENQRGREGRAAGRASRPGGLRSADAAL